MADTTTTTPLVLTSPGPGSVETGGSGNDTFYASQGNDTLTGGAGADLFVFKTEPWSPDHITDFQVGTDHLDLSALFQAAGYTGSDPVADGYIVLSSDGNGGTVVRFDHDGTGPNPQWPNTIIDLEGVSPTGLTWNQLSVGSGSSSGGGGTGGGTGAPPPGATVLSDGTYVQVTETTDQQHVFVDHYSAAGALLNEQRFDGMAYDAPSITATTDAGYVIDLPSQEHATTLTIEKVASDGTTYQTPSLNAPSMAQLASAVTAVAGGGFVVTANEPGSPGKEASFEALNATGQLQHSASIDGYDLTATADQAGGYVLSWNTFAGGTQSLTVDPTSTPDLTAPAAPQIVGYDHTTGQTFQSGAQINDPNPTIELQVTSDEVGDTITNGPGGFSHLITQADLSQGTIALPEATPGNDTYRLDKPDGVDASTTFTYYDTASSGGGTAGQVFTSPGPGSVETGTAGADTFYASQGNDTLTGGAGADVFVFKAEPWAPDHITDFQVGTDKLDLSPLFQAAGYTGSDPVADGYIYLQSDGNGGTVVRFDHDGSGPNPQWPNTIIDLEGVSPTGLTWSQLSVGSGSSSGGGGTGGGTGAPPPGATPLTDGSYVQVTETSDQQHVTVDHYSAAGALLNEQRFDGMAYDAPTITATSDAGYVIDLPNQEHATTVLIEKVASDGTVYQTPNLNAPLTAHLTSAVTAVAGGGFVVTANEPGSPGQEASFEAFDATGQLQHSASIDGYGLTATAEQGGGYVLSWTNFTGGTQSLTVDSTHSPDLTAPAAPDIVGYDHTTGQTFQSTAEIHDSNPTIELQVTADEVGDTITNGPGGYSHLITQADLAQGTIALPSAPAQPDTLVTDTYRLDKPDGVDASTSFSYFYSPPSSGGTAGQVFTSPGPGSVETGTAGPDTFYASDGNDTLTGGAGADVFVFKTQPWAPDQITDFQVGTDKLDLTALFQSAGYTGSDPVADHYIVLADDGSGGTVVRFDSSGQANINGHWPTTIIDLQGVSPTGLTWNELSVAGGTGGGSSGPVAGQVYVSPAPHAVENGTAGADTFYASQGGDQLTGGAGADLFIFNRQPWQPDNIADFQVGTDKLDVSALLQQVGYTGSDPVADGYITLADDGNGGTLVRFDSDGTGPNPQYPNSIIDLQGVSSQGLTWSQLSGPYVPRTGSGTGSSGGTPGQLITSPDGWSTEVGTPGNDTFIASQGGDTLTGGAGADVFALPTTPWQAVTITDFTPGEDKLDLSYLFKQAGYTGQDPIADHYITVESDGNGGSLIRYEASGQADINGHWPTTIIDLQGVAPSQVSEKDWIIH